MCPQYAMLWLEGDLDVLVIGTLQCEYPMFLPGYFFVCSVVSRAQPCGEGALCGQPVTLGTEALSYIPSCT